MNPHIPLTISILALFLWTCGSKTPDKDKKALARVADDFLYASELEGLGSGLPPEDSALQVQLYVKQWVEDALIMQEGKDKVKSKERIERLVQDFRTALIREEYLQSLVEENLDSIVSAQAISDYYEANKEQYLSAEEWVRCYFIKVPRTAQGVEELREWFRSGTREDMDRVREYCKQNKTPSILDSEFWIRLDRILVELPSGNFSKRFLEKGTVYDQTDGEFCYLYKTFEYKGADQAKPLSQVKDEIVRIILQQRRMQLIDETRQRIYEEGKKNSAFEIF